MSVKRMRIFAGPNGSGKSTFVLNIHPPSPSFKLGYYVNADDIEKTIREKGKLSFNEFGLTISTKQIQSYYKNSGFSSLKLERPNLWMEVSSENNCFRLSKKKQVNSYIAADLAEFLRHQLVRTEKSFSYETVMSDRRKITFLKKAKTIEKRYLKSLENLKLAVKISNRSYLFDNSKTATVLISEIVDGKKVTIIDPTDVPNWFIKYLIK